MHLSEKPLFAAWHQRDGLEEADSIWHCLPPIAKSMTTRKPQPRRTRSLPLSNGHISSLSLPFSQLWVLHPAFRRRRIFRGYFFLNGLYFHSQMCPLKRLKLGHILGCSCICVGLWNLWQYGSEDMKDFGPKEISLVFFKMDAVVLCLHCIGLYTFFLLLAFRTSACPMPTHRNPCMHAQFTDVMG